MKLCPRCKLANPDSAPCCDCGYDFSSGISNKAITLNKSEKKILRLGLLTFVISFGLDSVFSFLSEPAIVSLGEGAAMALGHVALPIIIITGWATVARIIKKALPKNFWGNSFFVLAAFSFIFPFIFILKAL